MFFWLKYLNIHQQIHGFRLHDAMLIAEEEGARKGRREKRHDDSRWEKRRRGKCLATGGYNIGVIHL